MADSARSVQGKRRLADQLHALSQLTEALVVKLVDLEERLQRAEPVANQQADAAAPQSALLEFKSDSAANDPDEAKEAPGNPSPGQGSTPAPKPPRWQGRRNRGSP
jgi:hypothetical protein